MTPTAVAPSANEYILLVGADGSSEPEGSGLWKEGTVMTSTQWKTGARMAIAATVSVIAAGIACASPASAESEFTSSQACWLNADTGAFSCFDNYQALASASGLTVGGTLSSPAQSESTSSTYVLATFYADSYWSGATVYITTSNSSRCSGYHYYGSSMPSGWNDRVSSFTAYGTCKVKLYHDSGYGGSTFGPYSSAGSLGSMNDEASSYQIYA